jgi:K+ transporter
MDAQQTSDERFGQIYVTQINWLLAVAVIGLVVGFRNPTFWPTPTELLLPAIC